MKLFLRRNAPLFYVLAAMLALYVPWLNRGYLNYEWGTVLAGRGLSSSEGFYYLQAYKDSGHANPLGYPFLISLLYRVFGYHENFWIPRIPSLFTVGLIVFWGYVVTICRGNGTVRRFFTFSLLLLLHPMISAFSTSAMTDIATVGFLLASLMLLTLSSKNLSYGLTIGSAFLFGLSSSVKYITPVFCISVIIVFLNLNSVNPGRMVKVVNRFLIFGLISAVVLLVEIAWKWNNTGVFVSTGIGGMKPNFFDVSGLLSTLIKYVTFLGLFTGGLPLFIAARFGGHTKRFWTRSTIFVAVVVTLGWIQSKPLGTGEMDFGGGFPFGDFANRTLQTIGFLSGASLGLVIYRRFNSLDLLRRALIIGLGPYLILISASRPAQRYLIYAIPIVLLILVEALDELPKKVKYLAVGSTALGFAAVSLLGMSYLTSQGNASEEMAVWVEENNLISQTSAGAISPHAGQHWWGVATGETRYEIIAVTPATEAQVQERVLHREPMKVLGKVTRIYLLRELPKAP
jgi:hypothetical protein